MAKVICIESLAGRRAVQEARLQPVAGKQKRVHLQNQSEPKRILAQFELGKTVRSVARSNRVAERLVEQVIRDALYGDRAA